MSEFAWILIGIVIGAGGLFAFTHAAGRSALARARAEANQIRDNARSEAANKSKEIELACKQEQLKLREQFEKENEAARRKLQEHEARLDKREDKIGRASCRERV